MAEATLVVAAILAAETSDLVSRKCVNGMPGGTQPSGFLFLCVTGSAGAVSVPANSIELSWCRRAT